MLTTIIESWSTYNYYRTDIELTVVKKIVRLKMKKKTLCSVQQVNFVVIEKKLHGMRAMGGFKVFRFKVLPVA